MRLILYGFNQHYFRQGDIAMLEQAFGLSDTTIRKHLYITKEAPASAPAWVYQMHAVVFEWLLKRRKINAFVLADHGSDETILPFDVSLLEETI